MAKVKTHDEYFAMVEDLRESALKGEQNQNTIKRLVTTYGADDLATASFRDIDWATLMKDYPDDVLFQIVESGTNHQYHQKLVLVMEGHAQREREIRDPTVIRDSHGMQ